MIVVFKAKQRTYDSKAPSKQRNIYRRRNEQASWPRTCFASVVGEKLSVCMTSQAFQRLPCLQVACLIRDKAGVKTIRLGYHKIKVDGRCASTRDGDKDEISCERKSTCLSPKKQV